MLDGKVLVLNSNYEPLNVSTMRRAIRLLVLQKAEMVYSYDGQVIRSSSRAFPKPSVIRLKYYIGIRREIPLTKRNILKRDNYTCQYCGRRDLPLTIDHVIPKRMGGKDTWENLVCACVECNNKKGDRTPEQAGMKLLKKPRKPSYIVFLVSGLKIPDARWKPFLFMDRK